jgi:hypothetical protein
MSTSSHKYDLFDFFGFIVERANNFIGREWVFAEIDGWQIRA